MKYNQPLRQGYKYAGYALLGIVTFLCGFSVMPIRTVSNRAPGVGNADVKVIGTSNLHDWSMEDKDVTCTAKFTYAAGKSSIPKGLEEFGFTFPVHSLKSGKSGMDSKAYDAMKAKNSGNITFAASSSAVAPVGAGKFSVKSNGSLTIAGVSKSVMLTAACVVKADGSITCTGTDRLLMTDYQIKPPTYMLGTLRTGNSLTIDFTMTVQK
jgi:polyisoprenoid-binding protein YceI